MEDNKNWDRTQDCYIERPPEVLWFLAAYKALCQEHNMSLSHEDGHGSFIIERYKDKNIHWVEEAQLNLPKPPEPRTGWWEIGL